MQALFNGANLICAIALVLAFQLGFGLVGFCGMGELRLGNGL